MLCNLEIAAKAECKLHMSWQVRVASTHKHVRSQRCAVALVQVKRTFCSFEAADLAAETLEGLAAGKIAALRGTDVAPGRLFCMSRSFLIAALAAVAAWRGTLVLFNGMSGVPSAASSILKRVCTRQFKVSRGICHWQVWSWWHGQHGL